MRHITSWQRWQSLQMHGEKGIGRQLGEALLDYARSHDVNESFSKATPAWKPLLLFIANWDSRRLNLKNNAYERCDILMELCLEGQTTRPSDR